MISPLYLRLGLIGSRDLKLLLARYEQLMQIPVSSISERQCVDYLTGQDTPPSEFDLFLCFFDKFLTLIAKRFVEKIDHGENYVLISFSTNEELWFNHEEMLGIPVTMYVSFLNKIHTIAKTTGIHIEIIGNDDFDADDHPDSANFSISLAEMAYWYKQDVEFNQELLDSIF